MNRVFLLALLQIICFNVVFANNCTYSCDIDPKNQWGNTVLFCGTDGISHSMRVGAQGCYFSNCSITIVYPGDCGCPNYCYSNFSRGECFLGSCKCNDGWGGPDCSQIQCPNPCGGNGLCIEKDDDNITIGDYCQCYSGWTGPECSTKIGNFSVLPYGELFPNDRPYYYDDKYGDHHPVWNLSVIATIKIQISNSDLLYLLDPVNTFNESTVKGSMNYMNQKFRVSFDDIEVKLRGMYSRTTFSKGWNVRIKKSDAKSKFYNVRRLGLKTFDPSFVRDQIAGEIYRAWNIPSFRGSYASVWINGISMGVFWQSEEFDSQFFNSRYSDASGNAYKCNSFLPYLGDDTSLYKNAVEEEFNHFFPQYQVENDDSSRMSSKLWKDLVSLVKTVNQSSDVDFERTVQEVFDVERYIRLFVIEVATSHTDDYANSGNNFLLYHNPETDVFEMINWDYDIDFMYAYMPVYNYSKPRSILSYRIMASPPNKDFRNLFTKYMRFFLNTIYGGNLVAYRIQLLTNFLLPNIKEDYLFATQTGEFPPQSAFLSSVNETLQFISKRSQYIVSQLDPNNSLNNNTPMIIT